MLIIEVYAPVIGNVYDFKIDENASIIDLKEEICVMICQKEQYRIAEHMDELMLFSSDKQIILRDDLSAAENGIMNCERLILV